MFTRFSKLTSKLTLLPALLCLGLAGISPVMAQQGITWVQEKSTDFTALAASTTVTNAGVPGSSTTGAGTSDWTDVYGKTWFLTGNTLQTTTSGGTAPETITFDGLQGELVRNYASGGNTLNQRVVVEWFQSTATTTANAKVRINTSATGSAARGYVLSVAGNAGTGGVATWRLEAPAASSYSPGPNGTLTATVNGSPANGISQGNLSAALVSGTAGTGHWYAIDLSAKAVVAGTSSNIVATLYDDGTTKPASPAAAVSGTQLVTVQDAGDTTAGLQSTGQIGMGESSVGNQSITRITTYIQASIGVTNNVQPENSTVTLNITGSGFVQGSNPALATSGLSSASLGAVTVTSSTTATATLTTGSTPGTLAINDSVSGTSATVTVQAMALTTPTLSALAPLSATVSGITASQGVAPYTYQLYRLASPAAASGTAVGTAQVTSGAASAQSDAPPTGLYFYAWKITDAGSQIAWSTPLMAAVPDQAINILVLGDSKVVGFANSSENSQWCLAPQVTNGGTGYTPNASLPLTISAPTGVNGIQATGTANTNSSGVITSCTITQRGWGYIASPTVSLSGGGGTGATFTGWCGGGWPMHLERMLKTAYGYHQVTVTNAGFGGVQSGYAVSLPGYLDTLQSCVNQWILTSAGAVNVIVEDVGVNDANAAVTAATYKSNIQSTIATFLGLNTTYPGLNAIFVLNKPSAQQMIDAAHVASADLVSQYGTAIDQIIAADSTGKVKLGTTLENGYLLSNLGSGLSGGNLGTNLTSAAFDSLHANDFGIIDVARMNSESLSKILKLAPVTGIGISRENRRSR